MAVKYREELVGKRFLALKDPLTFSPSSPKSEGGSSEDGYSDEHLSQVKENLAVLEEFVAGDWLSGVIRAATDKDFRKEDFQILVEFDDQSWKHRDWIKPEELRVLLVEETVLLSQRTLSDKSQKKIWWPALTFKYLKDSVSAGRNSAQPISYLIDNNLQLVTPDQTLEYKKNARGVSDECKIAAQKWFDYQDGQSILVSTPTVLVGERVQVYRTEGTTQWFTAVIKNYQEQNKELYLLDDTVLEEHYESAELTQIIPLDGVVESILKGTQVRTTQRRSRACKEVNNKEKESKEAVNTSTNASTSNQTKTETNPNLSTNHSRKSKQPAVKSTNSCQSSASSSPKHQTLTRQSSSGSIKSNSGKKSEKSSPSHESADKFTEKKDKVTGEKKSRVSVIQQVPTSKPNNTFTKEKSVDELISQSPSTSTPTNQSISNSRKRTNKKLETNSSTSSPETDKIDKTDTTTSSNHVKTSPASDEPSASSLDMHIKKKRILARTDLPDHGETSNDSIQNTSPAVSQPAVINTSSNPTINTPNKPNLAPQLAPQLSSQLPPQLPPQHTHQNTTQPAQTPPPKIPDHPDTASSGYNSAATTDSTVSPKERLGSGILASFPPTTPLPVSSATKRPQVPSPHAIPHKLSPPSSAAVSAPSMSAEPPIVPYRDPELIRKDDENRKRLQTTQLPNVVNPPAPSRTQAAPTLPTMPPALSTPTAAMMNPLNNPLMQSSMSQMFMNQLQMMSQYQRAQQLQSMTSPALGNPMQLFQQQQQQWAAAQTLMMEQLYRNQAVSVGAATQPVASWMLNNTLAAQQEKMHAELQRAQDVRLHDQKEQDRMEREKAEKERTERLDKERRQVELAKILKESRPKELAQSQSQLDAVNQHFNISLGRLHNLPGQPSPWGLKKPHDDGPQDLSKPKTEPQTHDRLALKTEPQTHDRLTSADFLQRYTEDKQKELDRHHDQFLKSIASQPTSSDTKGLVDEHFRKAASKIPHTAPVSHAESVSHPGFSLYGFQAQTFQKQFVTKDQLATLNRDERKDQNHKKSSTMPPTAEKSPKNYLIEQGLVPNPAHAVHPSGSGRQNFSANPPVNPHMNKFNTNTSPLTSQHAKTDSNTSSASSRASQSGLVTSTVMHPGQNNSIRGGGLMKSFKTYVENAVTQAFMKDYNEEEQRKKVPTTHSSDTSASDTSAGQIKQEVNGHVNSADTDSDTLSAPSPTLNSSGNDSNKAYHPKMKFKQEWRQRHEGSNQSPSPNLTNQIQTSNNHSHGESTTSASENEADSALPNHKKRKSTDTQSNGSVKKTKNSEVSSTLQYKSSLAGVKLSQTEKFHTTSGGDQPSNWNCDDKDKIQRECEMKSIKRLAEIAYKADNMQAVPYASKPLVKVNIATLRKSGQPFVQDGSCIEMAPKQSKCRECKVTPSTNQKKIPNIFCRFFAFRMLKFTKGGQITIAGFCDPADAEADDITIWLPHISSSKVVNITQSDISTAAYIISNVAEEFCKLVEQEQECESWNCNSEFDRGKRAWKRAVQGVREMCDVCDTTLFNTHWVCHRCGFVVCIDCYRVKRKIRAKYGSNIEEENRRWLTCTVNNKNHEAEKLMLTSIIPGDALNIAGDLLHHVRRKHDINIRYPSGINTNPQTSPQLNAVSQSHTSVIMNGTVNGGDKSQLDKHALLSQSYPQDGYRKSALLTSSFDSKTLTNYSDDPLSLLADVASMETSTQINGAMTESSSTSSSEHRKALSLRGLLAKEHQDQQEIDGNLLSPSQLKYYSRRSGYYLHSRTGPVPLCDIAHTSLKYPNIKHSWLCDGRLLRLHDAHHEENMVLFRQRWSLGQPVIVSGVRQHMKESLWTPQSFSRDFGHVRHDLVDCRRNESLTQYQIKHFWDGFEDVSKRLEDADGNPLILKLKDWPSGEDFSELMPERFNNLMNALPLPQYTKRNGPLNLAGRLPDFFVKPDLGPKMYNAYGLARYPQSGTTNLHLDISDAVNVMVYVSYEKHLEADIRTLIDNSDCDVEMKNRVMVNGEVPGALWHIYDATDADMMRDLLNKVALEQGLELEPYHDPIHDQQFYLDSVLRKRLADEYGVKGYAILQCEGDSVFIPAGAPHQVQNLNGCIKVAEDFVSPEHLHHCFNLTQEFRHLSSTHTNHEDKLQVKNIIYHAIKEATAILDQSDPLT